MAISSLYAVSTAVDHEDRLQLRAAPSVESVMTAVHILHEPESSPDDRSYASRFLTAIQSSPYAWSLADSLLIAKPDINSTYFAAQTIRFKIQTCFTELQAVNYDPLRTSLINHLNQITSISDSDQQQQQQVRVIINQLSLSLAYLIILDTTWSDPLVDLMSRITDPMVKLQVMTYVPEEVVDCNAVSSTSSDPDARDARLRNVGSSRRKEVIRYLSLVSPSIMEQLTAIISPPSSLPSSPSSLDHRQKSLVYRAFASWINVLFTRDQHHPHEKTLTSGEKITDVRNKLVLVHTMFAQLIKSLNDQSAEDDEHDSAADSLAAFITCFFTTDAIQDLSCDLLSGVMTMQHLTEQQSLLLADSCTIVKSIKLLESGFNASTEAEEIDKSVNIIRVFAETADASLDLLIALIAACGPTGTTAPGLQPLSMKGSTGNPEECRSVMQRIIFLILEFVNSHYENDVAESCFTLFHRFSDSMYSLLHKNNPSYNAGSHAPPPPHHYSDAPSKMSLMSGNASNILSSDSQARERVQEFAYSVTTSLIEGLRNHSKMEEDRESVLPIEDEFRDFRSRVRELLRDVVFMVGTEGLVQHLTIQFASSCQQQQQQQAGENWEDMEVNLFLISCLVHELFDRDGNSIHDQVIGRVITEVIAALTVTDGPVMSGGHVLTLKPIRSKGDDESCKIHPQVLATACDIFSELSTWLKMRTPYLGNILSFLFHVIISSKTIPDLMIAATGALEPIIESCFAPVEESLDRRPITSDTSLQAEDLLGTDERPALISICSQLDSLSNEDAAHHLLQSAANLISSLGSKAGKTLSPQDVRIRQEELMCKLLHPHLIRLRSQISLTADPTQDLDRVTSLFRPLKLVPIQSAVPLSLESEIVHNVWPLLDSVLETFCTKSERIIERACRTLRYILRSVRPVSLIIPVTGKISMLFQSTQARHSCFLYVLSILVDEFVPSSVPGVGNTCGISVEDGEKIANWMIGLLQELSHPTFVFLTQTRIRDHPDTIDDFFRLCMRLIQKRPEMFADKFSSIKTFQDILELAYHSLEIDQREANHSVTRFLTEFFESLQDKNACAPPTCPPTTPSPFSQSSISSIGSASSSTSSLTGGELSLNLNPIEKSRLIVIENFAARLIDRTMTVSLFSLPSYFIPDFADVIYALIQLDRGKAYEWVKAFFAGPLIANKLQEAVAAAGTPDAASSLQQQIQSSFDSLISARHAKGLTQTLRSIHRLFRNNR